MHELYELKEKLIKELENRGKGNLSLAEFDVVDKLAHTIKNLCKIIKDAEEEQYSGEGSYRMSYDNGGSYRSSYADDMRGERGTYSARRGRGPGARRDSMGRYSSADNQMMVEELRGLMEEAPDERTRSEFQKFIQKMEQM